MLYGYCRISTKKQSIDRQIRNIEKEYPTAKIIQEVYTGTSQNRTEWNKLNKIVKNGDTIIFDSVSRMSRNAEDGFADYQRLYENGVTLVFLKEPHINTDTYKIALENSALQKTGTAVDLILEGVQNYLMELCREQIRIAFEQSEKEVKDNSQRTKEGMLTAKMNGHIAGRKKGQTITTKKSIAAKEIILKHSKDFGGSLSDAECMIQTGLSRNTFYKYKRELKEPQPTEYSNTDTVQ